VAPLGSLIYDPSVTATIGAPGLTDNLTLNVNGGQTITVDVVPGTTGLQLSIELDQPDGTPIGTATASAAGQEVVLQTVAAATSGTYTLQVSGANNTTGLFTAQLVLNAALEAEEHGGPRNDTRATAQNLGPSSVALPKGASRLAVLGKGDGNGVYQATAVTPTFEDISATGHGTLQGTDDSTVTLGPAQFGSFQFPFYGTTYTSLSYSTNALISFGVADGAFSNTDLTTSPSEAAIAPLWTDYVAFDPSSVVYWQVLGSGSSQHLVIEWKNVQYFGGGPFLTFEAVLGADGSVQFNYQNVNNAVRGTAGLKDAGAQGPNRLLLAFNNGPNALVGNNQSTLIRFVPPSSDFYSFHLDAGQEATLGLKALGQGSVNLEVQDAAGDVLATGTAGAADVDKAIELFTAPAAGTYYARISTNSLTDYSLVVTRGATFDLKNNGSFATAQAIDGTQGVLGYLAPPVAAEWFSVSLTAGVTYAFPTSTPFPGSGQFTNTLSPHIALFDPSGVRLADGVKLADGRNESIAYTVPAGQGGLYRLEITNQNGTRGEFFLDPDLTPTNGAPVPVAAAAPGTGSAAAVVNPPQGAPDIPIPLTSSNTALAGGRPSVLAALTASRPAAAPSWSAVTVIPAAPAAWALPVLPAVVTPSLVANGDNRLPDAFFANQPDVRLAKVPVNGPGDADPPAALSAAGGAQLPPAGAGGTGTADLASAAILIGTPGGAPPALVTAGLATAGDSELPPPPVPVGNEAPPGYAGEDASLAALLLADQGDGPALGPTGHLRRRT
jgi:hypothetical protein